MIISVSGKIGNGKDTIGKLIQYLVANSRGNTIPEHSFYKDSLGKEKYTLLELLDRTPIALQETSGWQIKKFAGKIKQIATILTGIPTEDFEKEEVKDSFLGEEWNWTNVPNAGDGGRITVREFLQRLGTEAIRNNIHTNAWVNALFADYLDDYDPNKGNLQSNWIITDTRFPNELQAIKDRGGITIRVKRWIDRELSKEEALEFFTEGGEVYYVDEDGCEGLCEDIEVFNSEWSKFVTAKQQSNHISEIALDNAEFDYVIENNQGILELIDKVNQILIKENLI